MKKEIYICDRCGMEIADPIKVMVPLKYQPDPAGGHGDDIGPDMDLCPRCAVRLLGYVWSHTNYEQNRDILARFFPNTARQPDTVARWLTNTKQGAQL
jgi:hypothetical protein